MTSTPQRPALTRTESILVEATPEAVYDLVTSVERTGEWSPVCTRCSWDDGSQGTAGAVVGAWFTGHNEHAGRTWETRSQVSTAEPGRAFGWLVGGSYVRWGYELAPVDGHPGSTGTRTELTESWEFLPEGLAMFRDKFGDDADAQIVDRAEQAHAGIPATLAAIKELAERE